MAVSKKLFSPWMAGILLIGLLAGPACGLSQPEPVEPEPNDNQPALRVYFSEPGTRGLPEGMTALLGAIDAAQERVLVAMYNLTLDEAGEALLAAHERGVEVRVVMESDALDGDWPRQLQAAGIELVGDGREGLMHHKFVVIDEAEVWTGSWNLTVGGTFYDNNNLVRIRSQAAAENFATEFSEMFDEDKFGPNGSDPTPNPVVMLGSTRMEFYFSPEDAPARHVVELVAGAKVSVDLLAYSFTLDDVGEALSRSAAQGVRVRIVCDEDQMDGTGAECPILRGKGLDARVDGIECLMHHKVIVIDGKIVIFGSYNFTRSADTRNDEALVIVQDAELARAFQAEFERIYTLASD